MRAVMHAVMIGAIGALALGASACGSGQTAPAASASAKATALSGAVTIDGSSTVLPLSKAMAAAFQQVNGAVQVTAAASGTTAGFKRFCGGEIDIASASRPINAEEGRACGSRKIEYIELPVAFDSLSVVVNARNSFVTCLTVGELKRIWEPAAEGRVKTWRHVRASFPAEPMNLYGPSGEHGTFDYFTFAVVGTERSSRRDYTQRADPATLVSDVANDAQALGYFGYGYYQAHNQANSQPQNPANKGGLKLVAIDNGQGCVAPGPETVADHSYQPLSRPMFLYVSRAAAARPEAKAFARFYVDPDNAHFVREAGAVPLPTVTLLFAGRRLEKETTGSIFQGRGSVVGVTAEQFQDDEKVKNALVR
jgi:phosphate transport system substrate-binding protein